MNGIVFKNQAFIELQNLLNINDEFSLITQLKNDNNVSLLDTIQKQQANMFSDFNSERSIYSASNGNKNSKKIVFHVKKSKKKLKKCARRSYCNILS